MAVERLQKILSNAGVASRRTAEQMILDGRVSVNGVVQSALGARADTDSDEIMLDGVPVLRGNFRYFVLNKPAGFVTTASDEFGRPTVLDLVPIGDIQLHPVGRLDADSEGLLLLTNDGTLTSLLTHPRHEVEREYLVGMDQPVSERDMQRLVRGVEHEGERLRAASVTVVSPPGEYEPPVEGGPVPGAWVLLVLRQGKNREIRRMLEVLGRRVITLTRLRVGNLRLGTLGSGAFRELRDEEVQGLYDSAKRAQARAGGG